MSNGFRIFEAPSCEEDSLPIEQSPWFTGRDARIPLGHWELLIEFSKEVDSDRAKALEESSVGSFDNDDNIELSESEMIATIKFMEEIKDRLESAKPIFLLKDKVFNDIYDEYENSEYQSMLEAVISVYKESHRLGEPVCAYND
jgi:hypothetical protein